MLAFMVLTLGPLRTYGWTVVLALAVACNGESAPPITGTPGTHPRYIIGGDSRDDAAHVLPWAFQEAKARAASGFLFLGDMELTPQFDEHFRKELPILDPVPFYPVLGNHEVRLFGIVAAGHARAEKAFRERFLGNTRTPVVSSIPDKVVYSVNLPGGVHFVALDNCSQDGFGDDQLAWLGKDLSAARQDPAVRYIIVGMHKPLARNGVSTHSMEHDGARGVADSDAALALMVQNRVSLIVASHMHEYAKIDEKRWGGIPGYITGGLGAPLSAASADHAFHHFLQVEVGDDGLHVTVVRFDGKPSIAVEEEKGE
jgi:hypothetical protein